MDREKQEKAGVKPAPIGSDMHCANCGETWAMPDLFHPFIGDATYFCVTSYLRRLTGEQIKRLLDKALQGGE